MSSSARSTAASTAARTTDWPRTIILVFIAIGIGVTAYLSYTKLTATSAICVEGGAFNCDVVSNSSYSRLMGIPVAYLGFGTYLVLAAMMLLENRIGLLREYGAMLFFGIALFSFLFSVWLIYIQVFRLEALCIWCLAHEVSITIIFVMSIIRLRRSLA